MPDSFEQTTIRGPLLSVVIDHLTKGKVLCPHTYQVGCELVGLLAAYREEERRLYPEVFLIGPEDQDLLRVIAPGATPLEIGQNPVEADVEASARKTARLALKSCASLAIDGWRVFIRRDGERFRYGLFRPAVESYSVGPEAELVNSGLPFVILRNSAENTVEIVNTVGTRLEISLTTATPSKRSMSEQVLEFSQVACSDLPDDQQEQGAGYLTRVLTDILRSSHGALMAVAPHQKALPAKQFSDGVVLAEPIPVVGAMLAASESGSANAAALLRSHESLLRGMIMTDGVTVLGTDGSIKAFRVFVQAARKSGGGNSPVGGARSRAFEVLRGYLGRSLKAALFRSQDGRTEVAKQ